MNFQRYCNGKLKTSVHTFIVAIVAEIGESQVITCVDNELVVDANACSEVKPEVNAMGYYQVVLGIGFSPFDTPGCRKRKCTDVGIGNRKIYFGFPSYTIANGRTGNEKEFSSGSKIHF